MIDDERINMEVHCNPEIFLKPSICSDGLGVQHYRCLM